MKKLAIAIFATLAFQASGAGPVGYKLHAEGGGASSGAVTSIGDLKRWDENNLKHGEAVGKAAAAKGSKIDKELSPADVKRRDEIKVKNVLAAQEKDKKRTEQMLAKAKEMMKKKPPPDYVKEALDYGTTEGVKYGLGRVLEWTVGKVVGGVVMQAVDLLQVFDPLDPVEPYDLPKNKEEMQKLQKFMREYEEAQKALKVPTPAPKPVPDATLDPQFDGLRSPAALAEVEFKRAVVAAVKLKNADAGDVVNRLMASTMPGNPDKLPEDVIQTLREGFNKALPPNICFISSKDVCTLNTGKQGDSCSCPKLELAGYDTRYWARGIAARRDVSPICNAPVGKCAMTATGPVGTPCFCVPSYFVPGPMPLGKIVRR